MESGGSSKPRQNYPTRTLRAAGIVIQEDPTALAAADGLADPQESFKRSADQYMPITHVARIMRRALPPHAKIADDSKEAIQECISEFINFVTSEANERCHEEYRKTISADDVVAAMGTLGFDNYVEPLTVYMDMYRAQDPERPHHVPYARSGARMPVFPRTAAPLAPAPAQPVALPPLPAANYGSNYVEVPPEMGGYIMGNQGGGEGSSGVSEHDLLGQQLK